MEKEKKQPKKRQQTSQINLRLTEKENDLLRELAERAEMSVSQFIRERALNDKRVKVVKKEGAEEILKELRDISTCMRTASNNMNQIARFLNTHPDFTPYYGERTQELFEKALVGYKEALDKIIDLKKEWS